LFVLSLSLNANAQSFCGGAGYDVTSAVQQDLAITVGGWRYYLHPCGNLTASTSDPMCIADPEARYGSMVCQRSTTSNQTFTIASYNDTVARYQSSWVAISNGVEFTVQNGEPCAGNGGAPRIFTAQFVCNATATTAYFSNFAEAETCWYVATIHTSAACAPVGPTFTNQVGSSLYSTQCGGGIYDLTSLSNRDLYYDGINDWWWVRLCGYVQVGNCTAKPTSFCQFPKWNGATMNDVSDFNTSIANLYTITETGLKIHIRTGDGCGGHGPREATYNLICNTKVSEPILSFVTEPQTCSYNAYIQTPAVCTGTNEPTNGYCGGSGYDLSGLNGIDLEWVDSSGTIYQLHPCGVLSPWWTGNCPGTNSMFCQRSGGNQWNLASWNKTIADGATWVAITNGVQMYIQTGQQCGAQLRDTTIQFICNETATTPFLKSVREPEVCWYIAEVHTEFACDRVGPTAIEAPGHTYLDQTCGGRYWDLSDIRDQELDLSFDTNSSSTTNGFVFYIDLCGQVTDPHCNSVQPTMFCQWSKGAQEAYSIAARNDSTDVLYTINENGLTMSLQTGTPCGNFLRATDIQIVCDGANPAYISSVREVEMCHYVAIIHGRCQRGSTEPFSTAPRSSSTGQSSSSSVAPSSSTSGSSSSSSSSAVVPSSSSSSSQSSSSTAPGVVDNSKSSSSLSDGAIAGIVIGSIVGAAVILAVLAAVCCGACVGGGKKDQPSHRFNDLERDREQSTTEEVELGETHTE